jgi:transposase
MIAVPQGMKVWLAAKPADMRKGFDGLAVGEAPLLRHGEEGEEIVDTFPGHS